MWEATTVAGEHGNRGSITYQATEVDKSGDDQIIPSVIAHG